MGMGLQGAYGLASLDSLLARRKAEQIAAQQYADKQRQIGVENDYKNRALDLQTGLRQDALEAQRQNQASQAADRTFRENSGLAEAIQPGGDYTEDNPVTGRLRSVGAMGKTSGGQTLSSTQLSPNANGGVLRTASPGVADASIPNHYTKLETAKQFDTRTDNERQATRNTQLDAAAARTAAETAKRDADTAAYHQGMLNKPTGGGIAVIHTVDAQGNPVTRMVNKAAGSEFAAPPSATTANRLDSAKAVNQTGEDMIAQLSNPQFAANAGPAMGRFNTLRDFIGNPPPEFAHLAGQIESYALANMGVHGMRSAQGAEQIKSLLDQRHTPESLIQTIRGLNAFSEHFLRNAGRSTGGAAPVQAGPAAAPATPSNRIVYDMNGNPVR